MTMTDKHTDIPLQLVATFTYGVGWRVGIMASSGYVETLDTNFEDYYGRRQPTGHSTSDEAIAAVVRLLNRLAVKEDM